MMASVEVAVVDEELGTDLVSEPQILIVYVDSAFSPVFCYLCNLCTDLYKTRDILRYLVRDFK